MNKDKSKRNSLLQKDIFRPMAILILVLSIIFAGIGLALNLKTENEKRDINLNNAARVIADVDMVVSDVEEMNRLVDSLQGVDVVSIIDRNMIRKYHSNNDLIGTRYDGAIPDFSGTNELGFVENSNGPSGLQRRAYAPVYDANGEYIGFVLAIELMQNIRAEVVRTLILYAIILIVILYIALMSSSRISAKIKSRLLGFEPDVFSSMYHIRDNILDAVDEGIVAVDEKGEIQFSNRAAKEMISEEELMVKDLLASTLDTGEKNVNNQMSIDEHNIILDALPIRDEEKIVGALAVLRDRTEYTKLMENLTGTKYLVDSMRANNHDFTNKLHVILGLIQMEMYDKAKSYIENITLVQRESISKIMNMVDDPAVAALLIGKLARASELNIRLTLNDNCQYHERDMSIPSGTLITILGNLIDNALEAIDNANVTEYMDADNKQKNELKVCLISFQDGLYINVEDNGPGMSEEIREHIFEKGYSTKGDNRGTGLYQVSKLVNELDGEITVESKEGRGTTFIIRIGGKNVQSTNSRR